MARVQRRRDPSAVVSGARGGGGGGRTAQEPQPPWEQPRGRCHLRSPPHYHVQCALQEEGGRCMHTPAPRSLWLVPGRAPLTRGECGEDGEKSRGGRGGPAGANPGPRVRGAGGGWSGWRPPLAWRKLAPIQMATVSTRLGGAAKDAGDPAIARWRGWERVSMSVSGCERAARLTVTLAGPAGSLLRVSLLGLHASSPSNSSLPAPRGSSSRPLMRGAATAGPPPPPPPPFPARRSRSPPSPPLPPRCRLRLPRRARGRAGWGAPEPAVATTAAARGWRRPGASFLQPLGSQRSPSLGFRTPVHTRKRYFL